MTLNIKSEEGREILRRLILASEVVVDNFLIGTLERLGFDDAWYEAHAPQVVRCTVSGYGSTGPKAGKPGYDFILQAETGLMTINGEPDAEPMKIGVAMVDICAGMMAAISVLAGLEEARRTGKGPHAEVTLHDTGLLMLANVASNFLVSGLPTERFGNGHPNIVPCRPYRAADGELAVGVGNDAQFRALCDALGHPEWAQDPRFARNQDRLRHRREIDALIEQAISHRSRQAWMEVLEPLGLPCGPINSVAEALTSPQTQAREMVAEIPHPTAGRMRVVGSPLRFSGAPGAIRRHPPLLGEHTDEILGELGYNPADLDRMRAAGVI